MQVITAASCSLQLLQLQCQLVELPDLSLQLLLSTVRSHMWVSLALLDGADFRAWGLFIEDYLTTWSGINSKYIYTFFLCLPSKGPSNSVGARVTRRRRYKNHVLQIYLISWNSRYLSNLSSVRWVNNLCLYFQVLAPERNVHTFSEQYHSASWCLVRGEKRWEEVKRGDRTEPFATIG